MKKLYSGPQTAIQLDSACVIENAITKLNRELQEAKKSGNTHAAKMLKEKINALCMWLDSV